MFWKSTYNEFIKIAAKPRSYISLAAITVLVSVILFAMKVDGQSYISFIMSSFEQTMSFEGNMLNGYLMAFIRRVPKKPFLCWTIYLGTKRH